MLTAIFVADTHELRRKRLLTPSKDAVLDPTRYCGLLPVTLCKSIERLELGPSCCMSFVLPALDHHTATAHPPLSLSPRCQVCMHLSLIICPRPLTPLTASLPLPFTSLSIPPPARLSASPPVLLSVPLPARLTITPLVLTPDPDFNSAIATLLISMSKQVLTVPAAQWKVTSSETTALLNQKTPRQQL